MNNPGFVIGNIACADDFWNREKEIEAIWQTIAKDNILLIAPRRFGKTSITNDLYINHPENYKVFFDDTESIRKPEEFISRLIVLILKDDVLGNLYRSLKEKISGSLNKIEATIRVEDLPEFRIKLNESLEKDWQEKGLELINHLKNYNGNILFILDELPELIKNIERNCNSNAAIDFLQWFRRIRQSEELKHIRWLVGGSISFNYVVGKIGAGIKTINDFQQIRIGALFEADAREYIKALLKKEAPGMKIKTDVLDHLMNIIGTPIPYFIQMLLKESLNEMNRQKCKSLTIEIIEHAYNENILGPMSRSYFDHYYSRLKDYFDQELENIAKILLTHIAKRGDENKIELHKLFNALSKGKYNSNDFSSLMASLENDYYVSFNDNSKCYSFAIKVLRDWWIRYYDLIEA